MSRHPLPHPGTLDDLLWRAYVQGAGWPDGEYPDARDASYYEDSAHGVAMVRAFYAWRDEMRNPGSPPLPQAEEPVRFPWDDRS